MLYIEKPGGLRLEVIVARACTATTLRGVADGKQPDKLLSLPS
jgi:hypothetical protein